jgi:hypothetical protein
MPFLDAAKIRLFRNSSLFLTQLTQPLTLLNFLLPLKKQIEFNKSKMSS